MCFSATASFTMAGVLTVIGGMSIASISDESQLAFAAIPLGFAAQQATEGLVWHGLTTPAEHTVLRVAVFAFLTFALVIWPVWVPLALRAREPNAARRRWLGWLSLFGVAVAIVAAVLLVHWEPHARVDAHSVRYSFGGETSTAVHVLLIIGYVIPTLVPFFVSSAELSHVLGAALIIAMAITIVVRREALTSVWCFLAAGLSVLVLVTVRRRNTAARPT